MGDPRRPPSFFFIFFCRLNRSVGKKEGKMAKKDKPKSIKNGWSFRRRSKKIGDKLEFLKKIERKEKREKKKAETKTFIELINEKL